MIQTTTRDEVSAKRRAKCERGRPRMREVPETRMRNLEWTLLHKVFMVPVAQIARQRDVTPRTVRLGIADAMTYVPNHGLDN